MTEQELREAKRHMSDKVFKLFHDQGKKIEELKQQLQLHEKLLNDILSSTDGDANG